LNSSFSIQPLAENAALVSFGNVIDVQINKKVIAFHRKLLKESFFGFVESVPAYASLGVFYNLATTFDKVKSALEDILKNFNLDQSISDQVVLELPVLYDGEDLDLVADQHQLTCEEVITIHSSKVYRVFMIGFLPGFSYMGTVDDRIATPRKSSPRTKVPAGSVGIAGIQTGIYPQASPGGWQLIGRTPLKIFNIERELPCLLNPGDVVKFSSIGKAEFEKLNEY